MDPSIADALSRIFVVVWFLAAAGSIAFVVYQDFLKQPLEIRRRNKWLAREAAKAQRQFQYETLWHAVRKIEAERLG